MPVRNRWVPPVTRGASVHAITRKWAESGILLFIQYIWAGRPLSPCKVWVYRTIRAGCSCENVVFVIFLFVTLCCDAVYVSILMLLTAFFFQKRLLLQMHYIVLTFVARWRHDFAKLRSKITKSVTKLGPFGITLGASLTNFGISVLVSYISSTGCLIL